jgi:hypothetical protein
VKAHADHFPPGFPLPGAGPVALNTDSRGLVFQTLWRNLNIFHKQVGFEGYNPLHLNGFEDLADNHPKLFSTILQNPLVYLSGNLLRIDSLEIHENEGRFDPSGVYLENVDHQTLSAIISNDKPGGSAVIREFSPLKVVVDVNSTSTALLNLLQNNYPGWKITIDGKPGPVYTGNLSFMATPVAAGQHEVVFEFRPRDVVAGFLVSLISVILLIIIAVIPVHRKT